MSSCDDFERSCLVMLDDVNIFLCHVVTGDSSDLNMHV